MNYCDTGEQPRRSPYTEDYGCAIMGTGMYYNEDENADNYASDDEDSEYGEEFPSWEWGKIAPISASDDAQDAELFLLPGNRELLEKQYTQSANFFTEWKIGSTGYLKAIGQGVIGVGAPYNKKHHKTY